MLYLIGLAVGVLCGIIAGGSFRNLTHSIRLRWVWLLYLALAIQLFVAFAHVPRITSDQRFALLLVSYGLLVAWLVAGGIFHRRWVRAGFVVIGLGTLSNLVAIAANHGLPVSRHALKVAGAPTPSGTENRFALKHVLAGPGTRLRFLGDVIPIPPLKDVASAGDVAVLAGIALAIGGGMAVRRPEEAEATAAAESGPALRAVPGGGMDPHRAERETPLLTLIAGFASKAPGHEASSLMNEDSKPPSATRVVLSQAMAITDANLSGNVHGGVIMKLVDTAAGLAAVKHAHGRVVTVSMDEMSFLEPVFLTDVVTLNAQVNDVGRTSMEVGVRVEAENTVTGRLRHVSSAYLVFVALDEEGRPRPVARLEPGTDEERRRMEDAKIRRRHRIARKEALLSRRGEHQEAGTRAAQDPIIAGGNGGAVPPVASSSSDPVRYEAPSLTPEPSPPQPAATEGGSSATQAAEG